MMAIMKVSIMFQCWSGLIIQGPAVIFAGHPTLELGQECVSVICGAISRLDLT